ncbi:long-chain-fatty-acid--CoA ligase [Leucobacter sp. 1207-22]|uniref:long-chain-fatty-acid--CoA ligase n=1 Tax=Leucobacter sp. 1207-22 TaxID=2604456 RepID=UPI004063092B
MTAAIEQAQPDQARPWVASYAEGVRPEIDEVTQTLPEALKASSKRFAHHVALEFFGRTTTYKDLYEQVERAAAGLRKLGVRAGDRVALVLPSCPQHVVAFYAVLRLGAVVVEHNPLYTERELRHQFEDHEATVAIVWDVASGKVDRLPADVRPAHIITVNMTKAMPGLQQFALRLPIAQARAARTKLTAKPASKDMRPWESLFGSRLSKRVAGPKLDDIAVLQYTSGTTGRPKGAILTHANLRANAMQGREWLPGLHEGDEVFYGVLPLFHAYGLTLCLTFAMSIGAKLVLFPTFDVDLVKKAAKKSPPTFLPGVPPMYDRLARAAIHGEIDLSTIRFAISGAMPLPVSTVQRWEEVTGGLLVEGYGMTEASPVALGNPAGPARRPGSVGVPFPSTEIRVINPDDPAVDVEPGQPGELLLRGPQVFQGYWKRPEETAETLLQNGWLRTGDIVTVSADGFVTVVDRKKELIITGGFNVSPSEVEEVLLSHPDIEDAAVVAMPRGDGAEMVAAAIVVREGADVEPEAVRSFCRSRLAAYKVPKRVDVLNELPRSLIGKVLRREVRELLLASGKKQ